MCPMCNDESETVLHSLLQCSFARECFQVLNVNVSHSEINSLGDWLLLIFDQCSSTEINKVAMLCWMIWKVRNELVWNQKSKGVSNVVESASMVLNQWQIAQDKSFVNHLSFMTQDDGFEHWRLPMANRVKVNVDAAIFEASNRYSFAIVVRGSTGELIQAMSSCREGNVTPDVAEGIAIREALSWVKTQSRSGYEIETDWLLLVQAIRSDSIFLTYLGRIIEECKALLTDLKDRDVILRFVKRSANNVSHYLARYSSLLADRIWRMSDVHPAFHNVLLSDLLS